MAVRTITVRVTGDVAQFTRAMKDVGVQVVKVEQLAASSTKVFQQMRGGMASLAQTAIGQTVPGLSSLAGVLGTFAVGSTATIAVLGGIAAVAGSYQLLTKGARETAKAADEALAAINKPNALEQARLNIEALRKEVEKLNTSLASKVQAGGGVLGFLKSFITGGGLISPLLGTAAIGTGVATAISARQTALQAGIRKGEAQIAARELEEFARALEAAKNIIISFPIRKILDPFAPRGPGSITQLSSGEFVMSHTPRPLVRTVSPILGGGQREGAIMRGMPRTADQLEEELRQMQAAAESMAQSVATAFESWVTGAQKAKDAVRDMVTSILRDLLRLVAQRAIVEPLAGVLLSAIGGSKVAGGSRAVVVNQSVNFAISAIDAPGVASLLQQQSGTIAQIVGDAARRSTGFRAQLVGG